MSLLGFRPRAMARTNAHSGCTAECVMLGEVEHVRRHLLEDLATACAEAVAFQKRVWMRFAIFEGECPESIRDGVTRCSHKCSRAQLISSSDALWVMDLLQEIVAEHSGIHLSNLRDINTERPRSTYIIYEVQVEPGFQLPSN